MGAVWLEVPGTDRRFEINRHGVVRTANRKQKAKNGVVVMPYRVSESGVFYSLMLASGKRKTVNAIELVNELFGWRIKPETVLRNLAGRISRKAEKEEKPIGKKRRCHDCGAPTWNYRCEKCWQKLRQKYYDPETGWW